MKQSQAWKNFERETAKILGGRRIYRGDDFSRSDVDVALDDLPHYKIDNKYRKAHAHHSLMEEILRKYCVGDGTVPVLVTKHHRQDGSYTTIPTERFAYLIALEREQLAKK